RAADMTDAVRRDPHPGGPSLSGAQCRQGAREPQPRLPSREGTRHRCAEFLQESPQQRAAPPVGGSLPPQVPDAAPVAVMDEGVPDEVQGAPGAPGAQAELGILAGARKVFVEAAEAFPQPAPEAEVVAVRIGKD